MKSKMVANNPNPTRTRRKGLPVAIPGYILRTLIGVILSLQALVVVAQSSVVSGRITDELGEPVPGVNVVVKGTTTGTGTDLQGRYSLNINGEADVLIISAVGFDTQEISVGQRTVIDVELLSNLTELDEVVVTGYSTLAKKDISSSIAVVDVDDMKKIAASNIGDQLQGKVAGVQVSTSGDPGSFQYVRVRGIGTINNNEPLYVIDGVPVQNETNMNFLNPNDIESMQVLKDAAAASIYGARAANGVIVITTRKGKGQPRIKFDFFMGRQQPQNFPEVANPSELLEIEKGAFAGAEREFSSQFYVEETPGNWVLPDYYVNNRGYLEGSPAVDPSKYVLNTSDPALFGDNYPIAPANKEGTDWFREVFQPASFMSAQFSAESGDDKGRRYFSFNYFKHDGVLIDNKWQRFQTRLNSDFFIGKNVRLGENINLAFQSRAGQDTYGYGVQRAFYFPTASVYDIMGYWATPSTTLPNPVADQVRWADGTKGFGFRLTGNAFAEADLLKFFTLKTTFGLDYNQVPTSIYIYTCPECSRPNQKNLLVKDWSIQRNWVWSSTLNFNRLFDKLTVNALGGVELRDAYWEGFKASGTGLKFGDDPNYRELSNIESGTAVVGSNRSSGRMASAFLSGNFTVLDKYILLASVRADGSSRFVNDKYGIFPGISAAWRISGERFLTNATFLNELKLRSSWGITGNNEVVGGDYPGFSSYGTSLAFSSYPIDGSTNTVTQGFAQVSSGNTNLRWETSTLVNIGFDATLWRNLDLSVEWYKRTTEDMIFGVRPPLETGIPFLVNTNIGSMENKGVDAQLTYHGRALSNQLSYSIGLTGTHYRNKVLALADSNSFIGGPLNMVRTEPGYPVSQLYGYIAEGLWQTQQQIDAVLYKDAGLAKPGRMKFRDINEDGQINDMDRTLIGNPLPKFILGLNATLNYRNFDLTTYLSGVFGNKLFNVIRGSTDFYNKPDGGAGVAPSKRMLYEAGKTLPVLDFSDNESGKYSTYWVEDGSFVRLRSVVLGYTLSKNVMAKAGISTARIYFQAQNLFTWTKYNGMDPDVTVVDMSNGNTPGRDLRTGVDLGRYPLSRQFIIGLNIEF